MKRGVGIYGEKVRVCFTEARPKGLTGVLIVVIYRG